MESSTAALTDDSSKDVIIGYIAMCISVLGFGTMFVPLRYINGKDGFFVQWVECSVVIIVGFIINCIRGFPDFQWIAAIGGVLYATGNVFSVPIVGGIGMALGLLIWGSMQILVGWGVARFGLFGWLSPSSVEHDWMNYLGLALTILGGVLLVFVKREEQPPTDSYELTIATSTTTMTKTNTTIEEPEIAMFGKHDDTVNLKKEKLKVALKKIPYIIMAVGLAVFHGLMLTPIDILKQKYPPTDTYQVFDYCWSFYSTAFVFSTLYFFAYVVFMRKNAYVESNLIIPSIIYGCLWTTGMTFWFLSSDKLSQVVAYPITTRLPAVISALIEVFIFKTITGTRNIVYLMMVIIVCLTGVVLIALSNQKL